jgi:hypothetical protein
MREFLGIRSLALGAAAATLVIGLFFWNMVLQGELRDLQGQIQGMRSHQASRMVALKGPGVAHGARAVLMVLHNDRAVLIAKDMPPVSAGKTFQIWVIDDDVLKPSGLFKPKKEWAAVVVEKPLDEADAVAVTVEPDGGSPEPTTDPMLTAKL